MMRFLLGIGHDERLRFVKTLDVRNPKDVTVSDEEFLAAQFEEYRTHLRAVAYRMLGSTTEADDAVQEAWFRLARADTDDIENMGGWLTTVVSRVCLDMLRARRARRDEPVGVQPVDRRTDDAVGPEHEALLADSVGVALLVVLDTLEPAERLAFVLHDMFAVPFDEIAPIVGRTPTAARQLASRARRRVRGADATAVDVARQREVVDAFLAAARGGDFDALLAVLDPDVVFRTDAVGQAKGAPGELVGASAVAQRFQGGAMGARTALVDGEPAWVVGPNSRPNVVLLFTFEDDRVVAVDAVMDPDDLATLEIASFAR
jgi:RNA polymerase sigma-70 factor (ECF subfamily)